jgi:riboflavin biosynthesis pyrimidine reductase
VEVVAVAPAENGRVDPRAAFEELYARGIRRLLCEGGGTLLAGLWGAGLVQQVMAFVAPMVIGGIHGPRPFSGPGFGMHAAPRLEEPSWAVLANDALLEAFVPSPVADSG